MLYLPYQKVEGSSLSIAFLFLILLNSNKPSVPTVYIDFTYLHTVYVENLPGLYVYQYSMYSVYRLNIEYT